MIDNLDILKKDCAGAREAIRWLETEFKRGNRLVQTFHVICTCLYMYNSFSGIYERRSSTRKRRVFRTRTCGRRIAMRGRSQCACMTNCATVLLKSSHLLITLLAHRRYVQILDCAKYLTQQSSEMETSKSMVSILSNHKVHSPEISIRVKQVLVNAQQEGSRFLRFLLFITHVMIAMQIFGTCVQVSCSAMFTDIFAFCRCSAIRRKRFS